MDVSWKRGTAKSSIWVVCSISTIHLDPFGGTPHLWKPPYIAWPIGPPRNASVLLTIAWPSPEVSTLADWPKRAIFATVLPSPPLSPPHSLFRFICPRPSDQKKKGLGNTWEKKEEMENPRNLLFGRTTMTPEAAHWSPWAMDARIPPVLAPGPAQQPQHRAQSNSVHRVPGTSVIAAPWKHGMMGKKGNLQESHKGTASSRNSGIWTPCLSEYKGARDLHMLPHGGWRGLERALE